ncbi:hypothetical protein [Saccharopolyspora aridisoli]|nr:hypothetical protein [Saccharopolyspora aridisoli]
MPSAATTPTAATSGTARKTEDTLTLPWTPDAVGDENTLAELGS